VDVGAVEYTKGYSAEKVNYEKAAGFGLNGRAAVFPGNDTAGRI